MATLLTVYVNFRPVHAFDTVDHSTLADVHIESLALVMVLLPGWRTISAVAVKLYVFLM